MIKFAAVLFLLASCETGGRWDSADGDVTASDAGDTSPLPPSAYACQFSTCGTAHTYSCGCVPAAYVAPGATQCSYTTLDHCPNGCGFDGCL